MQPSAIAGGSIGRCAAGIALASTLFFTAVCVEPAEKPDATSNAAVPYPTKPIRILVTNSAGSGADVIARLVAQKLTHAWGQQVVVDNRPGGGGNVGGEIAARATPDGYTLMLITSSNGISTALFKKLSYDLLKDFSPISLLATAPFILVVHPSLPAASVKELVALAKSRPGKLYYASSGAGTAVHLAAEIFKTMSGTNIVHVPYRGLGPALTDLMSGQVQLAFAVTTAVSPIIKAGRLRALGVTSLERSALAPDLPAISEFVPGYEAIGWYGMLAPKGAPGRIVSRLNAELTRAFKTPESQEQLSVLGATPIATTPQEFRSFMETQIRGFQQAVRDSGMRVE